MFLICLCQLFGNDFWKSLWLITCILIQFQVDWRAFKFWSITNEESFHEIYNPCQQNQSKKLKIGHKSVSGDIPRIMCYFQTFQSHYQLRFSQQRTDPIYIYCNINVSYSDSAQPIFTLIPNWEILLSISAFGELRKQPLVGAGVQHC